MMLAFYLRIHGRLAILLWGLCMAYTALAQLPPTLTRGEVFNFAAGDTFQYRASNNRQLMPRLLQMVITGKDTFAGGDSVVYRRAWTERAFQPTGPSTYATVTRQWEDMLPLGHLPEPLLFKYRCDSIVQNTAEYYCKDTLYNAYGARKTLSRRYNYHFALSGEERYAAGLGLCLELHESEDPGVYDYWELVYFHKKGQQWGAPQWVAVNRVPEEGGIRVFPNPADQTIHLALPEAAAVPVDIRLYNALGAPVLSRQLPYVAASQVSLSVEELPAGWYVIALVFADGRQCKLKFLKK